LSRKGIEARILILGKPTQAYAQGIEPRQSVLETNSPALEHWRIYVHVTFALS
jgi:hypothetical protein